MNGFNKFLLLLSFASVGFGGQSCYAMNQSVENTDSLNLIKKESIKKSKKFDSERFAKEFVRVLEKEGFFQPNQPTALEKVTSLCLLLLPLFVGYLIMAYDSKYHTRAYFAFAASSFLSKSLNNCKLKKMLQVLVMMMVYPVFDGLYRLAFQTMPAPGRMLPFYQHR